ncbi:neuromedin-U receptor 2-like [Asterias amurensis]|uniref:neuromedin-U receptor 2-like n=1 Tax=Asterias amurensis TaxID=7602 RepID=UPI003AB73430
MGSDVSTAEDCNLNNTGNLSTAEVAQFFLFSPFEKATRVSILPVILAIGLIGNAAFLFTIAQVRSMRTATNFYLSNLAVSDSVFLSIAIVTKLREFSIYGVPNSAPLLGRLGCVLGEVTKYLFSFAGMIFITFISLERYIAVCHPLRHRLINGSGRSVKLITLCWLVALLLAMFVIPANLKFIQFCLSWPEDEPELYSEYPTIIGRCAGLGEWAYQLFHLTQTIPFFVAFFGNAFFYTRILLKLHQRDTDEDRKRVIRIRNQVATMLVANGTVFFLTTTPFEVTSFILFVEGFLDSEIIPQNIRPFLFEVNRILLYINSAINPIVYTVTNARYRRAFRKAFMLNKCSSRQLRNTTLSSVTPAQNAYQLNGVDPSIPIPASEANRTGGPFLNHGFDFNEHTGTKENENAPGVFHVPHQTE